MAASPTQRSLEECRRLGWQAEVVEKWIERAKVRKDLFGCIDILALDGKPGSLGIQATSATNVSDRIRKARALPDLHRWLLAGNRFEVWGWRKIRISGRWALRRVELVGDPR